MVQFECDHCKRETATNHYMRLEYTTEDGEEVTKDLWECDDCKPLPPGMKLRIDYQQDIRRQEEEGFIPLTNPPEYEELDCDPEELYGQ